MDFSCLNQMSNKMSHKHKNESPFERLCRYYDPFNPSSTNNCKRASLNYNTRCWYHHLNEYQFKLYIDSQSGKELRELAFYFYSGENYRCASYAFSNLIESEPYNAVNNFGYAQTLEALNDVPNAQRYYLNALEIAPNDDRCHSLYACFMHTKLKDIRTAKQYYITALKLNDSNPFTHCNYGKLLQDVQDFESAEYHYKECLSIAPNHRKCLQHISRYYHNIKRDLNAAKQHFDVLMDLQSNKEIKCWYDYYDYSMLLKDMQQNGDALIHLGIALNQCVCDTNKADIHYQTGLIYDDCFNKIQNAQFHFYKAALLNDKQYNMFYEEFMQHHKLKPIEETTKHDTTYEYKTSTMKVTQNKTQDESAFKTATASTKCTGSDTDSSSKTDDKYTTTQYTVETITEQTVNNNSHEIKECKSDINRENTEQSSPQREFKRFLKQNKLLKYYDKFVEKGYDDMRYLDVLEDDALKFMSRIHLKYLKKQIEKFLNNKDRMEHWLKSLGDDLYCEYSDKLEQCGIFTFESFYRIAPNKLCLLQIIGSENELDADILFNNTPKQARKIEYQMEGVQL